MSKITFYSFKQVQSWLKERTEKEFFMSGMTNHDSFHLVVCRDGKLDILRESFSRYYYTEKEANKLLEFIETGKRYE